jgi:hypothetical protein
MRAQPLCPHQADLRSCLSANTHPHAHTQEQDCALDAPGRSRTCVMRPVEFVTALLSGIVMTAHTHCVRVVPGRGLLF